MYAFVILVFVIRDFWFLQFHSVLIEIMELSLKHKMPHLGECWWGQVFTDVIFANIPAIYIGWVLMGKLNVRKYDIFGMKGKKSFFEWDIWHW